MKIGRNQTTVVNDPPLLGLWPRIGLSVLFASCGIWLLAYCLALLHTGQTPVPISLAWAWKLQVTLVFYRAAPILWLALAAAPIYGTTGVVTIGCLSSALYLATPFVLFLKERVGVSLALATSATSTLALAVESVLVAMNSRSRWHTLQWVAALLGYAGLTYVLGKVWVKARKPPARAVTAG
jgi:hypothetical protein